MSDVLAALTAAAGGIFREKRAHPYAEQTHEYFRPSDPVLRSAREFAFLEPGRHPEIALAETKVFAEADLAHVGPIASELDPMIVHAGGGMRTTPASLVRGLFTAAYFRIFCLQLPADEGTFVQAVLEGFEELRRAARGERIRAHIVSGIAGVTLPGGAQLKTPWGTLHPAPPVEPLPLLSMSPETRCILVEPRLLSVRFDRAQQPEHKFDGSELDRDRSSVLLPLACALAAPQGTEPGIPLVTWSTISLPFEGAFSYSSPLYPGLVKIPVDVGDYVPEIEEWARVIERSHSPSVDIAARRLATAVAHRADPSDALIDAVMVWENLVGTDSEVSFRVTAALAKALESNRAERRQVRKSLRAVYNIRSRVVHGAAVEKAKIAEASKQALDVALRTLRVFYRRGSAWLATSSVERADTLILEDP